MTLEIPGYYYDEEKKRYFKIEDNRTAPAQASWSSINVKRRRVETKEAELRREREARNAGRVKRAVGVWNEPLIGGCFLGREIGLGLGTEKKKTEMEDLRREGWTMGLRAKGSLRCSWPGVKSEVTLMYIVGEKIGGKSGLGVGYTVLDDQHLTSSYIPRDDQDDINYGDAAVRYPRIDFRPHRETAHAPGLSSLSYHAPSHRILLTSRKPSRDASVAYFLPTVAASDGGGGEQPVWRLGTVTAAALISASGPTTRGWKEVHSLRPAPASSSLTAVAGTNVGVLKLQGDKLTWLTWCPPGNQRFNKSGPSRGGPQGVKGANYFGPTSSSQSTQSGSQDDGDPSTPIHGEIFSVDFLAQNPAEVILAAGRSSDICLIDMRCSERERMASYIRHKSSVAHVRSVGEYGVLAAGPMSAMAIYDVRFTTHQHNHQSPQRYGHHPRPLPVVTFPEYKNEPHLLQIGLDVSDSKGGGLGIVAAAQDDGTVGLFSLESGRKLRSSAVDGIHAGGKQPSGLTGAAAGGGRVIKSLMFQTLPGDRNPSLFVGEGSVVKKYSFGMAYSKKGGRVLGEED